MSAPIVRVLGAMWVAMIFDSNGNAIDCFDYNAEELRRRSDEILQKPLVTMEPSPWATLAHSPRVVVEGE